MLRYAPKGYSLAPSGRQITDSTGAIIPATKVTVTNEGTGAMVFELRQRRDGSYVVRVYYTTRTMDQQRNLTPLVLSSGPAIAPIFIPNASAQGDTWFDCSLADFNQAVRRVIRLQYTN